MTQKNTANAEESAAAEELSHQADKLRQMLTRFVIRDQQGAPALGFEESFNQNCSGYEEEQVQLGWG